MTKAKAKAAPAEPLKNAPLDIRAMLAKEAAESASKISVSNNDRIKFMKGGTIVAPDGSEGSEFDVVILDFVSVNLYYDRPYQKDVIFPPACFAIGESPSTMVPSKNAPVKCADTCASCAFNQFESALVGKGKACKNTRLIAVAPIDAAAGEEPIWIASIPPTSIKPFDAYVSSLAVRHNTSPLGVVTTMYLDPASDFAAPRFKLARALENEELEIFFAMRDSAKKRLFVEPDVSGYEAPVKKRGR